MPDGFLTVVVLAGVGALASVLGGAVTLLRKPTTLFLSIAVGFAGGVLLGTFAFEMLPKAADQASLGIALAGFSAGFALVFGMDLFVHRGVTAGEEAEQHWWVVRRMQRRRARGDSITVLAGGTSAEELIEGIAIGVSAATDPSLALFVGLAIALDNAAEGLSIGELALERGPRDGSARRILFWTGLIGVSLFVSAVAGWFLLRGLSPDVLGFLIAAGAGGMFYLTVTQLVPEAESHQFNQSAAFAIAAGFLIVFALSRLA
jgi:ZIP family zinc transporter